jgi:hypothetical protein
MPYATITFPREGGKPTAPTAVLNMDVPAGTNSRGAATLDMSITGRLLRCSCRIFPYVSSAPKKGSPP